MPVTYCGRIPYREPSLEELRESRIYHITVKEDEKGRPIELVICTVKPAVYGEPDRYSLDIYADYKWEESGEEEYTVDILSADVDWATCDDCPLEGGFTDEKWLRKLGPLHGAKIRRVDYLGAFESTEITIYASFSYTERMMGLGLTHPVGMRRMGCYEFHASVDSDGDERYLEFEVSEADPDKCYKPAQLL